MKTNNDKKNIYLLQMESNYMTSNCNEILDLNSSRPTITEQLPEYNETVVESKISNLKITLDGQEKLNILLKRESSEIEKDIQNINFFVENYKHQISNQVDEIGNLVQKLKVVVTENKELETSHDKLNAMIHEPEMLDIAQKMKYIKEMSKDIDSFLEKNGI